MRDETALTPAGELGERLRAARAKIGMTRRALAEASGTSERYLANLEGGEGNPSLAVLSTLARALDMPVVDLLPQGGERTAGHARTAALLRRLPESRMAQVDAWLDAAAPLDPRRGRRIVLIGLRGAGKSSLGAALAGRFGVPFREMSREVEKAYGGEMRLLIELGGQSALRRYEHEAWDAIVAQDEAAVIATPGGIVADPELFDRVLATAHAIWLEATPDDHMNRVIAQGDFRPMSGGGGAMDDLKAILEARTVDYARAGARLDTSAGSFDQALARLERVAAPMIGREMQYSA